MMIVALGGGYMMMGVERGEWASLGEERIFSCEKEKKTKVFLEVGDLPGGGG